jgi:hypothetical protein
MHGGGRARDATAGREDNARRQGARQGGGGGGGDDRF